MDKLRKFLSGNDTPDEESGFFTQLNESTTFSWSTRIQGFIACFVIGMFLTFLSTLSLFLHKGIGHFAIFYTLGNIVSLLSTCFLLGPFKQVKRMFEPTRAICTTIYLLSLILTIISAVVLKNSGLALIFMIIQFLAMLWYSLSYIPFARDAVKKTFSSIIV